MVADRNMTVIRRVRNLVVKTRVEVSTVVVEGYANEADLAEWVKEAIDRHHTFRGGFINHDGSLGGIVNPIVREIP